MSRSLFILMLVGLMAAVGYYYERRADGSDEVPTAAVIGTAVETGAATGGESALRITSYNVCYTKLLRIFPLTLTNLKKAPRPRRRGALASYTLKFHGSTMAGPPASRPLR